MTDLIRRELGRNERLLWSGSPRQGLVLRGHDAFMIPFSLMWAGFAVFWEVSVLASGAPFFFALWGIPFLVMGAYITVGRFFVDAWQRAGTAYGVTSERIVIVSGLFSRQVKSLNLDTLTDVSLTERSSGGGTITFGPTVYVHSWSDVAPGTRYPGFGRPLIPNFELASDARSVYEIVREAQRATKGSG